jgi:inner membrane protein
MEPVTHVLTGACLARSGLNRRAAYATLAMAISAELPDIDTLWGLRGPIEAFRRHRGITHTFLGIPVEAAIVVLAIYGLHSWRVARARRSVAQKPPRDSDHIPVARPLTLAPVRWGTLYLLCLVALLSHLLLDYTNSYGLRPFFPFNPRWYAASIVSIFDPWIFALLLFGLIAPTIFRLVSAEIGARRRRFASPGWSWAALLLIAGLWGVRWIEHGRAVELAMSQSLEAPQTSTESGTTDNAHALANQQPTPLPAYLTAQRALASPDPLSIFRWYSVTDFGPVYQLERVDTREQTIEATEGTFVKPDRSPATLAAMASPLGQVYIDWSPMPILTSDGSVAALEQALSRTDIPAPAGGVAVTFQDPRFMGDLPWRTTSSAPPLTGTVVLDDRLRVVLQALGNRIEP